MIEKYVEVFDATEHQLTPAEARLLNRAHKLLLSFGEFSPWAAKKVWNNFVGDGFDSIRSLTADAPDLVRKLDYNKKIRNIQDDLRMMYRDVPVYRYGY